MKYRQRFSRWTVLKPLTYVNTTVAIGSSYGFAVTTIFQGGESAFSTQATAGF